MRPMSPIPMMPTDMASMVGEGSSVCSAGVSFALCAGKKPVDAVMLAGSTEKC